ncbi:MAG: hypothetical protein WCR58_09990 [Bacteroidales bacterium]|jgi:hypothetical protein|nr:hypothetical protein [Bacteroidales bacterium]MCK9449016.1 hypothetical protein [Bacteroidales bacterium]MDD3702386.1 hypothetical protein [Bacteroidales bacterium]MDY0369457.1 hypothetical protein [Bacteroidales bacterium]
MNSIQQIEKILKTDFEKQLFEASLKNLKDKNNVLRYHNFCYSIRELSRHFLNSLSPEEFILNCPWFVVETDNGKPTRSHKIKYAIQGGLSDGLLEDLEFDIEELKDVIKEMKSTIDSLSKYTHINPENFVLKEEQIQLKGKEVLETFGKFVNTIIDYRKSLQSFLDGKIEENMLNAIIYNSYENIDCLAPHYSLEYGEVSEYHIAEITDKKIIVNVFGYLNVILEYGSRKERANDDGLDISQSFPFETQIRYEISDKFPSDDYEVDEFDVDTSEWYGGNEISNEDLEKLIEEKENNEEQ